MDFLKYPLLLFLFIHATASGQALVSKNINTNDGLPSSEVYCILQDQKGFIWIGTDQGLAQFEGKEFVSYTSENGLSDNTILDLHEEANGDLWLGTMSIDIVFLRGGEANRYFFTKDSFLRDHRNETSRLIGTDSFGKKWMTNFAETFLFKETGKAVFSFNTFPELSSDRNNLGYFFKKITPEAVIFDFKPLIFPNDNYSLRVTENGSFLCGPFIPNKATLMDFHVLRSGKILAYNSEGLYFIIDGSQLDGPNYFPLTGLVNPYEDKAGNIWFCNTQKSVFLFENGLLDQAPKVFLKDYIITQVLEDSEGNFWFTDHNQGLHFVPSIHPKLFQFGDDFKNTRIASLKVRNGKLWFSTINGEIWNIDQHLKPTFIHFDPRNPYDFYPFEVLTKERIFLPGGKIFNAAFGKYGLERGSGQKEIELIADKVVVGEMSGIVIFDATTTDCEYISNKMVSKEVQLNRKDSSDFRVRVNALVGNEKELWIGSFNGLYLKKGLDIQYLGNEIPLLSNRVMALAYYLEDYLLIGTKGAGLIIYHKKEQLTKRIDVSSGLPSNMIRSLYISESGRIYIGTNKGMAVIELSKELEILDLTVFDSRNLLPSNEVNDLAEFGGKIWIATTEGLVYIEEKHLKKNESPPPVYIAGFSTNDSIFQQTQMPIALKKHQRNITINFNGIGFKAGRRIKYQYYLTNFNEDIIATNANEVRYTNLNPGEHTFFVWAINEDGIRSSNPATVRFTIPVYFEETLAYKLLISLAALSLVLSIFYFLYRRKRNKLNADIQTTELKQQALTALMNPHFIYNSLSAIQHFINVGDREKSNAYLSQFSRLVRQNLNSVRKGTIILEQEVERLELYLKIEKMRFGDKLNYAIDFDDDTDTIGIVIPSMIIQPFVENAIWHGILPLEGQGAIKIHFKEHSKNMLIVQIEDNGIGIQKSLEGGSESKRHHTSLSMEITAERLKLMERKTGQAHTVKVSEIAKDKGGGTAVTLMIPILN